ncbi:hypothetical protein [Emticicia fontis]
MENTLFEEAEKPALPHHHPIKKNGPLHRASNLVFGENASAEHVRLLEVLREKMKFGSPTKLIELIETQFQQ